ncbi:hypothetical protein VTI74DRAFT_807 [Chaetomium olivicolor]
MAVAHRDPHRASLLWNESKKHWTALHRQWGGEPSCSGTRRPVLKQGRLRHHLHQRRSATRPLQRAPSHEEPPYQLPVPLSNGEQRPVPSKPSGHVPAKRLTPKSVRILPALPPRALLQPWKLSCSSLEPVILKARSMRVVVVARRAWPSLARVLTPPFC